MQQKIGSGLVVSNHLQFFCCLPRCRWWASCPESRALVGPVFGHPDRRAEDWCCLTWRTFFKRAVLQENIFFPSRPTFSIFIIMDFLIGWCLDLLHVAHCWELWPPEQPWASGLPVGLCSGAPQIGNKMKEVRVKHWYDMDAFNTSFVFLENSALFSTWSLKWFENHDAMTLWWNVLLCWSRRVRSLKQDLNFACPYRLLDTFFAPSLCSFTVPPWKARSTPKFWWR